MLFRVFIFLSGAVFFHYQVLAGNVYLAELVVESNITLEAQTLLSILNSTNNIQVNDSNGAFHTVNLASSELIAECVLIGDETSCNCSTGYVWSNTVCYNYNCCRETTCMANVSHIVSLCVEKITILLNGSVEHTNPWLAENTDTLQQGFEVLNGLQYVNITGHRSSSIVEFEAAVSVLFSTNRLQEILTGLEGNLQATLTVDTQGIVSVVAPNSTVCYRSEPELKCSLNETVDGTSWSLTRPNQYFQLNDGSVVQLNLDCATPEYQSCISVKLKKLTGIWEGTYKCEFFTGSIAHTARINLKVALLPDEITLKINPLTVRCEDNPSPHTVVTASVLKSTESYRVWWSFNGEQKSDLQNKTNGEHLDYVFTAAVSCQETSEAQYVNITFENSKGQTKTARVDIPVIYPGKKFCEEEVVNGDLWPETPAGDTILNRTCKEGLTGYRSRTCTEGRVWMDVFYNCIDEELAKVVDAAENFLKGLGATQEVALNIFEGLKNSSVVDPNSRDKEAGINASITVLDTMSKASKQIRLEEQVIPDLVDAASNMLNDTWNGVNDSVRHSMSSNYLIAMEDLVKNIKVNKTSGFISENLDIKFCAINDCNMSLFDIGVILNKTTGILKTMAVKKLVGKLKNTFRKTEHTDLLLSATLSRNNDSNLEIKLDFPFEEEKSNRKFYCVFWDVQKRDWSDEGCFVVSSEGENIRCECHHLTAFSVLMAKGDISNEALDTITTVGLSVSVFCLLLFLAIEFLVWSAVVKSNLSHFRHTAIVNIAVFLLLANCSFLASTSPESLSDTTCFVLTVCKHLFYLAMFTWMLCMSVMLVHQLIFVFNPLRKRVFMFLSSILGYVVPILIVGSSYIYCKYTYRPYYNKTTCWLVFERLLEGSMHAFLIPVGTIMMTNLFSMVVVIVTLVRSSVPDSSKADDKDTAKGILKVVLVLTPIFGVTWIIGFFLLMLEPDNPMFEVANYSFTILNSFQGLFLLITGCFAEQKVREEFIKIITGKSKGGDTSKTFTSTTNTKDK